MTVLNTLSSTSDPFFSPAEYADQRLLAIRRDGTISRSWQLNAGNGCWLEFFPAPAIGDFNQDGITDIAVTIGIGGSSCSSPTAGVVTVFSTGTPFHPGLNDWPLVRRDPRNTSVLYCSDFCLAAGPAQTVHAGSSAGYTITVTPGDTPYDFPIQNFNCAGLPIGASCSFSPASVTPGALPGSTSLEISTTSQALVANPPASAGLRIFSPAALSVFAAGFAGIMTIREKLRLRRILAGLGFLLSVSWVVASCGGGSAGRNPNGTPAGSYTVTVSATGESGRAKSATLNLIVN